MTQRVTTEHDRTTDPGAATSTAMAGQRERRSPAARWPRDLADLWAAWPIADLRWSLRELEHLSEGYIRVEEVVDGDQLVIRAELPGVDPDRDIDLTVSDGVLWHQGRAELPHGAEARARGTHRDPLPPAPPAREAAARDHRGGRCGQVPGRWARAVAARPGCRRGSGKGPGQPGLTQ